MIKNAREWASGRGLIRKNEGHKLDEFKIPTSSTYSWEETKSKEAVGSVQMEIQDPDGAILDFSAISAESALMPLGSTICCAVMFREHTLLILNFSQILHVTN